MKEPKYLRDMDHPTVFGYELDRTTLTPIKRSIEPANGRDYGADPTENGMFKMVPSGDIVDYAERCKRLEWTTPKID